MSLNYRENLSIVFDNAPSSHKEGFLEDLSCKDRLLILHFPSKKDKIHPSELFLKRISFEDIRYHINTDFNNSEITDFLIDIIKKNFHNNFFFKIRIIYSFLDFQRLSIVDNLRKICKNYSNKIELIPYYEPIRINDIYVLPRLLKFSSSILFQKFILKPKEIYLFSKLNIFIYELFFKNISIFPYKSDSACSKLKKLQNQKVNKIETFKDNILRIIFVGQLIKRKNPMLLLKACSELNFNVELSFIGEGIIKKDLERFLIKNSKNKKISCKFYGMLDNNLVDDYLKLNDCLVLPSKFDGFGFVISEAINNNLFAIVSDQVGAKDLLIDNSLGSVFTVNSKSELKNQLNLHFIRRKL